MCYLCEARGLTGPNYRETQKLVDAALRTWRRSCGPVLNNDRRPALRADMTKAPQRPLRKKVAKS